MPLPGRLAEHQNAVKIVTDANPLIGEEFKKYILVVRKSWKTVVDREKIVVHL